MTTKRDKEKSHIHFKELWEAPENIISEQQINNSWNSFYKKLAKKKHNKWSSYIKIASVIAVTIALAISFKLSLKPELIHLTNNSNSPLKTSLNDGTIVVISPGSTLVYPENFKSSTRSVLLKGESFFKVTKNTAKPFEVTAGKTTTHVLGTSFNIDHNNFTGATKISVFTGAVQVNIDSDESNKKILTSGQQLQFKNKKLKIQSFNKNWLSAWRLPNCNFKDAPLKVVIKTLEKRYGVLLKHSESKKSLDQKINLSISKSDSLQKILRIISLTTGVKIKKLTTNKQKKPAAVYKLKTESN
ncbi:MAG: FecR family protein [Tenacibaculum sp.]